MQVATLSSKFQICIPKQVREQMHLEVGQKFVIIAKGEVVHLVPMRTMKDLKGILAGASTKGYRDRKDRV